jgi:hypothetical protein
MIGSMGSISKPHSVIWDGVRTITYTKENRTSVQTISFNQAMKKTPTPFAITRSGE